LELNDYTVLAAADGFEGLKLAERRPDFIFCDITMPGMSGYQAIEAIQKLTHCRDIPFVFLTALADREAQRRGMMLGADDFITKPFTESEILEAITARIRRLQPLRERIEALLAARNREVGAQWSHELMTPLTGILGGLQLIEEETDTIQPAELKDLLRLIRDAAERQHELSQHLVLYFELEQLKAAPQPSPLSYCNACESILAGVATVAEKQKRSADLTVHCDSAELPLHRAHFSRAVAELVGNALRFSQPGQPVTVTGTRRDLRYYIEITDQGPGMTEDERTGIGPFTQFGRSRREQQGLGLGLAIARSVVKLGGGEFSLQPGPGDHGLRVMFDLPCN
jgi:signal transduction histidine kinase